MELGDLASGLEVLEHTANGHVGQANGDGAESVGVEVHAGLEDVDRRLRGEGVALLDDLASDLAWFDVVISGNGEGWPVGRSFSGSGNFWGWSRRGCLDRRVDESGGRGRELMGKDVGGDGRHVMEGVWCCCRKDLRERIETLCFFRPLLSCSDGINGFLW